MYLYTTYSQATMYRTTMTFKTQFFPQRRIWFFFSIFSIHLTHARELSERTQWKLRWRRRLTIDDAIVTNKNNTKTVGVYTLICSYDTTVARRYIPKKTRAGMLWRNGSHSGSIVMQL